MAVMNIEVYDALRSIGVDDTKSRAAAASIPYGGSLATDMAILKPDVAALKVDVAVIRAEITFHRWAFAIIIGLQLGILTKLLLT